jgi:hypothetical protein
MNESFMLQLGENSKPEIEEEGKKVLKNADVA